MPAVPTRSRTATLVDAAPVALRAAPARAAAGLRRPLPPALAALAVAGASILVVAPAPSYDPWAWLLWGREIAEWRLSTSEGPAFKPLPVAICVLLAALGDALAPPAWVLLARAAAAAALVLSYRLAVRLAGGSRATGILAAGGVALTGSFLGHAASGLSEPALVAFALAGLAAARCRRPRVALACATACALIRVETWPFLLLAAVVAWRRASQLRRAMVVIAPLVALAWFGPELVGSGDVLRSGSRALVPNPGQPALAPVPAWASLSAGVALPPWPLWAGVGVLAVSAATRAHRTAALPALAPAALGGAWLVLVAAMAQAGFSGEPRYALPGAALISISGAVGAGRLARAASARAGTERAGAAAVLAAVALIALADRHRELARVPAAQAHHWRLGTDLGEAVAAAGGRDALLACGTPYVGPYRGTLAAYHLDVAKHVVEPDEPPRPPGVVLRSRLKAGSPLAPAASGAFRPIAANPSWQVLAACAGSRPGVRVP